MAAQKDYNTIPIPSYGPASRAVAIVKSDATDLTASKIRSLWVGGAGDVAVLMLGDTNPVTFVGVPAGTLLPIMVTKVMNTNTTATSMLGLI